MLDVVTVGWLTLDNIVLVDHTCQADVLGGGALYSAIGARIWTETVGLHSATGQLGLDEVLALIAGRGLDPSGIAAVPGNGLQLWLLHESASAKQQVPKLTSSTADEMTLGRGPLPATYADARGFHIAPQTPLGSIETARDLAAAPGGPVITLDLLSDEFIDRRLYADLSFLDAVTAFLPSEAEVERIWNPPDLHAWLRNQATGHACHIGVKLGEQGSLICDFRSGDITHVPVCPVEIIDTTGAGDGYCGGFVAGLVAGHTPEVCAAMGTVSASYVVEACGALMTIQPNQADRDARLSQVIAGFTKIT